MLRLDDDRGAVAVIIAILMVPLLGFAAISIDVAAMHAEKQQLQAGADAAALAIAQDCARGTCGSPRDTAQTLATANSNSGNAEATVARVPDEMTGRVTVDNAAIRKHWFAPIFGIDETAIQVSASASWGSPTGGTAVLPLILSLCHLYDATGLLPSWDREVVIEPAGEVEGCEVQARDIPGGFGWIETDTGHTCHATTRIGEKAFSEPGNTPKRCDLSAIRNKSVLLPIYDQHLGGNGRGGWYEVYGYAAFTVTGYYFSGQSWNPPCDTNKRCISGYFTQIHRTEPDFDYGPGAPNLGAAAVFLLPD